MIVHPVAQDPAYSASTLWNGAPLPFHAERVVMPDGRQLDDAVIWPGFCQNELRLDPAELWDELLAFPTLPSDQPIPFRERGDDPHWIPGDAPALKYRGHVLRRGKIWVQSNYAEGCRRYRYSGWQYKVALATHAVEHVAPIQGFAKRLNGGLTKSGHKPHNHWIVTRYEDEEDNIGYHSDKDADFAQGSYFLVIKLGASRRFALRLPPPKGTKQTVPFFDRVLDAGTAVFVRAKASGAANDLFQHGVPPCSERVGLSGSIVSRCIETIIPWSEIKTRIAHSEAE